MYLPGGTGSGVGSGVTYTAGYRAFLEGFMEKHAIRSVLDVGCGDWQFSRLINWGDRLYVGLDEVQSLIDWLNVGYGTSIRGYFTTKIPSMTFDLCIVKDVMIHLPNAEVIALLGRLAHHKHLLIVNDIPTSFVQDFFTTLNVDVARGHYRPLDITHAPFNVKAEIVYRFPQLNHETKVVHHRGPA
jgi:SAM-dependent methyltransferase